MTTKEQIEHVSVAIDLSAALVAVLAAKHLEPSMIGAVFEQVEANCAELGFEKQGVEKYLSTMLAAINGMKEGFQVDTNEQ